LVNRQRLIRFGKDNFNAKIEFALRFCLQNLNTRNTNLEKIKILKLSSVMNSMNRFEFDLGKGFKLWFYPILDKDFRVRFSNEFNKKILI